MEYKQIWFWILRGAVCQSTGSQRDSESTLGPLGGFQRYGLQNKNDDSQYENMMNLLTDAQQ